MVVRSGVFGHHRGRNEGTSGEYRLGNVGFNIRRDIPAWSGRPGATVSRHCLLAADSAGSNLAFEPRGNAGS